MSSNLQNDNIYIDMLATNTVQTSVNDRVATSFFLNNSQDIIKDSDGYQLAVTRFALNTQTLPIFIPTMNQDNTATIYSCTMEFNGSVYQQYMPFIPQNPNPVEPEELYYVYNYQYVIYLINNMLKECFNNLNGLIATGTSVSPKFFFEVDQQVCGMQIDPTFYGF